MVNELAHDEIVIALSDFYELGMRDLSIDGGEPLSHRHIDEIVDWLVGKGVRVAMNTNGILAPRKINTVSKLSEIRISLDGPKDCHDSMRGAGTFDKALVAARAAQRAGVHVEFTCTVGRHNADRIEELLNITESLNIPVVFQPALNSLFQGSSRNGSAWQLGGEASVPRLPA